MTTNELKAAMALLGITTMSIARRLGVTCQAVSPVITGQRPTPYIQAAIAEAINRPVEEVFDPVNYPPGPGLGRPRKTNQEQAS